MKIKRKPSIFFSFSQTGKVENTHKQTQLYLETVLGFKDVPYSEVCSKFQTKLTIK